ncbi:MAG: prepilin-type N-terminal cleavage/methylation domain-containing protein [Methylococcaceae bacterium]|jgi:type IV pilus modification protein PilV
MKKILHTKMAGFTLIEALIAALVVGVGMLGLAKLQGELFISSSESRMRTHALNLAQDKIEEFRKVANQDLYSGFAGGTNANTETIMAGSSANFTRTWEITNCPNSVACKQISVTVSWTDSKGVNKNVQLTSNVASTEPVKSGILLESPDGCSALVTAAVVTGTFETAGLLLPTTKLEVDTSPYLQVCALVSVFSDGLLGPSHGTYICNITGLPKNIVKLSFGGKEIDLSVNVALSDIPRLLPTGGLLSGLTALLSDVTTQLQTLQTSLGLPPKLVCIKAHLDLPVTINASGTITAG